MTTNKTDYFKIFCKINKAFGTTLKQEELLDLIVQNAIETMNGKAACLFLAEEESSEVFTPVAQKGLSENYLHASPMAAKQVVSNILKEGGYLAVRDATTDPRVENHEAKKSRRNCFYSECAGHGQQQSDWRAYDLYCRTQRFYSG
jgi:signal transduction protein with GAF and PtsI domain